MEEGGVYTVQTFGPVGQTIKVIMLDTSYFRSNLEVVDGGNYRPNLNQTATILGDVQWEWLDNELRDNPATITLIVSSIQVFHENHPGEKWSNFPSELKKFRKLMDSYKNKNLFVISGDRHYGTLFKDDESGIFEFTSSGVNVANETASVSDAKIIGRCRCRAKFWVA